MNKTICDRCNEDITNKVRVNIEFNEFRKETIGDTLGVVLLNKDLCKPCYVDLHKFFSDKTGR